MAPNGCTSARHMGGFYYTPLYQSDGLMFFAGGSEAVPARSLSTANPTQVSRQAIPASAKYAFLP